MTFRGKFETRHLNSLALDGTIVLAANAGTTGNIRAILFDSNDDILLATGTDVPTDTTSGYAKGCIFIDTDVATGTGGSYENVGTNTSCNFDIMGTIGALSVDTAQLVADAVTGAKIEDDAVSKEHLDSGISPNYITLYAGELAWTSSGATMSGTVSGIASGDIITGSIATAPTQAATLTSLTLTADTVIGVLSAANTSNDCVVNYNVVRATT